MSVTRAAFLLAAILAGSGDASAQSEPVTRAEALRQQREEKSKQLSGPERSGLERALLDLESGRTFERLLNPAEGLYPKVGNVTAGSGFSLGPGYRKPLLFGGHADFSAFAAGSFQKYWLMETRLRMPRLAGERVTVELHAQRYDFPDEDFFGLGPSSRRQDHSTYGLRDTVFGGNAAVRPLPWLSFGGGLAHLSPRVSTLPRQPDFVRYEAFADVNYREPRGNPRRGGRYALTFQRFDDDRDGLLTFQRVEAELQQYVPLLRDRRVLALHALMSMSDAEAGRDVPFYFMRTLGGPDDLRGFRRFRFRDRHMLLLQAEYRWEIFTAVDGAIFYDAGKVASRAEDLTLEDLESDVGIGFRFGTRNGVFLRVEGAFGSSGGAHFIFRFGHVF